MATINSIQIDAIVLRESPPERSVDVRGSVVEQTRQGSRIVQFSITCRSQGDCELIIESAEAEVAALLREHHAVKSAMAMARGVLTNSFAPPTAEDEIERQFEVIHAEMDKTSVSGKTLPDLTVSGGGRCTLHSKSNGARVTAYLYADARFDSGADIETHFFVIPPDSERFAVNGINTAERELLQQPVIQQALRRIREQLQTSAAEMLKPYLK
jgi:hypothetical protein